MHALGGVRNHDPFLNGIKRVPGCW